MTSIMDGGVRVRSVAPLGNRFLWWLTLLRPRLRHFLTDHNSRPLPLPPPPGRLRRAVKSVLLRRYAQVFCVSRFVRDCLAGQRVWPHLACCPHFVNRKDAIDHRPHVATRKQWHDVLGEQTRGRRFLFD